MKRRDETGGRPGAGPGDRIQPNASAASRPDFERHRSFVEDTCNTNRLFSLRDAIGRLHLCRATSEMPLIGASLVGPPPSRGSHLLVAELSGQVHRTDFERLACDQMAMLLALHPGTFS